MTKPGDIQGMREEIAKNTIRVDVPTNHETPDIVYGRLLEAAHFGGYAAERVVGEFKWLLDDERYFDRYQHYREGIC